MKPKTVLDAYQQYKEFGVTSNTPRLIDNLRTVLRRYILPSYNFSAADLRHNLENSLAQVPLDRFLQDCPQFLETFDNLNYSHAQNLAPVTLKNYRSTLLRFLNWMYDQGWQTSPSVPSSIAIYADSSAQAYTPQIYSGQTLSKARKGGRSLDVEPYALKEDELTNHLKHELEQLHIFWTTSSNLEQTEELIDDSTSRSYMNSILCFLGWHQNILHQDLRRFHLKQLIQLNTLKAFINWGLQERGNSYGWATNVANSVLAVARYLSSRANGTQFERKQKAIQAYLQDLRSTYRQSLGKATDEETSLTPSELEQVVAYLKQCCAPLHLSGIARSETAILKSWERYLIVALLTYCPINQREIRELEWERSLIRDADGYLFCLGATERMSGRKFRLPEALVHDMDKWRREFHPKIPVQTNRVFVRLGSGRTPESFGQPLNSRDISDLVSTAIYKATSILFDEPKRSTIASFQRTAIAYLGGSMQQPNIVADRYGLSNLKPQEPLSSTAAAMIEISKLCSDRENLPPQIKGLVEESNRGENTNHPFGSLRSITQAAQAELERTDEQDNTASESLDNVDES